MTHHHIPGIDLKNQYRAIQNTMQESVMKVLESGQYILGAEVEAFEKEFGFFLKADHVISVNSGTDALALAVRACDIGPGDEVITTPITFVSTVEAIIENGAKPVFVDVNVSDSNMNADLIEEKITPKTKAILPVHLYGTPCDMDKINAIAMKHGLRIIEDCAQAAGAQWDHQRVGTLSDMGCFSFYPTKNLGAYGDGGAIVARDEKTAARLKSLRTHGSLLRGYYEELGKNSRLDEIQATILRVKLLYVDRWNAMRGRLAQHYKDLLSGLPNIKLYEAPKGASSVHCLYCIRLDHRERVQDKLAERGISTMVHYPSGLHTVEALKGLGYKEGDFPVTEKLCRTTLSLPMFPELTFQDQETVVQEIRDCLKSL